MNAQSENAIKYFEAMVRINKELFNADGTRKFDAHGGNPEYVRVVNIITNHRNDFPRSRVFAEAIDVWVGLITRTAEEEGGSVEVALDWAVVQGGIYAGYALPNVPGSYFDSERYEAIRTE